MRPDSNKMRKPGFKMIMLALWSKEMKMIEAKVQEEKDHNQPLATNQVEQFLLSAFWS